MNPNGRSRGVLEDISNKTKGFTANIAAKATRGFQVAASSSTSTAASSTALKKRTANESVSPLGSSAVDTVFARHPAPKVSRLPLDEVDIEDVNKPRHCSLYVNDIFHYFRESETKYLPSVDYMDRQEDLNERMRSMLINWMVEVHHKFKLLPQTMYLTVNILDRFLDARPVARRRLQLAGCTAMLIASKYEEIYAPEAADFVYVSDHSFTRAELLQMESVILNTLSFNITFPSAYVFLGRFTKVADCDSKSKLLATYLVEQTLQDYTMLQYTPSKVAAAALLEALRTICVLNSMRDTAPSEVWTELLVRHTQYTTDELEQCIEGIKQAIRTSERRNLRAVAKKYSTDEFLNVSTLQLA